MKKIFYGILLFIIFSASIVYSLWINLPPNQISWGLQYGDRGYAIELDSLNNIIFSGYVSIDPNNRTAFIAKLDNNGNVLWSNIWSNPNSTSDLAYNLEISKYNPGTVDYIGVVGLSRILGTVNYNSFFLLLDPNGAIVCNLNLEIDGYATTEFYSIPQDTYYNLTITNLYYSYLYLVGTNGLHGVVAKFIYTNSYCDVIWLYLYRPPPTADQLIYRDVEFWNGSLYLVGDIIYQSGNRDTVLSIIDPNTGDNIISYIFETPVQDVGFDLELDSNGTAILTGWYDDPTTNLDVLLIKFDNSLLCGATISGPADDVGRGLAVDIYGNIHIVGRTNSFTAGPQQAYIVELFPDCSLIKAAIWDNATSSALDVEVGNVDPNQTIDYNMSLYITGYFQGNFPNPLTQVLPTVNPYTANITSTAFPKDPATFSGVGGNYGPITGNLNTPMDEESFIIRADETKPIIDEFPTHYILLQTILIAIGIYIIKRKWS